jgi:hypothetical protein
MIFASAGIQTPVEAYTLPSNIPLLVCLCPYGQLEVKYGSLVVVVSPYKLYQRTFRSIHTILLIRAISALFPSFSYIVYLFVVCFTTLLICDGYTASNGVIIQEWWLIKDLELNRLDLINHLKNKINLNYFKIHFVPRSKHTASGLRQPVG